jgi:Uma2 family endonuclease
MEVVSEGVESRRRDYDDKRHDYERAGIPEYWIVDPDEKLVTVLVLDGSNYRVHGEFRSGQVASGILIPALRVTVDEVWKLGDDRARSDRPAN